MNYILISKEGAKLFQPQGYSDIASSKVFKKILPNVRSHILSPTSIVIKIQEIFGFTSAG